MIDVDLTLSTFSNNISEITHNLEISPYYSPLYTYWSIHKYLLHYILQSYPKHGITFCVFHCSLFLVRYIHIIKMGYHTFHHWQLYFCVNLWKVLFLNSHFFKISHITSPYACLHVGKCIYKLQAVKHQNQQKH